MNAFLAKKNRVGSFAIACTAALALLTQAAGAANLTWDNGAATGNWNTTDANWSGSTFTNGGVDNVFFTNTAVGSIAVPSNVSPASMTVNNTSGTYVFTGTGAIQGGGVLNKSGAGILEFQNGTSVNNNNFSGINFGGGEIVFNNLNTNQLGSGTINVTANSILTFTRPDTNGATISNPMNIGSGLTMTFRRAGSQPSPTYSGKISGNADLVFDKPVGPGGNGWTINNATNDFTGSISVNGGAAAATFSNNGSLGAGSLITVNGGTLNFGASVTGTGKTVNIVGSGTLGSGLGMFKGLVTGAGISINNLGLDNANNSMASIFNNQGTLRVGVPGSLGSGAVSYTSNPNNFLEFADPVGGTFSNTLNMSSGDNRTLKVEGANATINWTGNITDVGTPDTNRTVTKLGPGTFITTNWGVIRKLQVNEGRFLFNDSTTSNVGDIIVASGATFGGTGNLVFASGKSLTVNGTLQPGSNGAGTLSIFGPLNLTSTTLLDYQLGTSGNDLIQVNGNLVLDGSLQVTANGTFGTQGSTYTLFTYTGTLTNNGLNLIGLPDAVLDFSTAGQVNLFIPIPTPEPATAWLIGLPALIFARKLRRNRK